jgi:hypothetical protein
MTRDISYLGPASVKILSVGSSHRFSGVYIWLCSPPRGLDQRTAALDLRCILWTLQTSISKLVHTSTLKHLITFTQFANLDSDLVMGCFNIFIGCISVSDGNVVITHGLEQFATLSVTCFSKTLHLHPATRSTSSALEDLRRRYNRNFPSVDGFLGLPFYHTMTKTHALVDQKGWHPRFIWRIDYRLSNRNSSHSYRIWLKPPGKNTNRTRTIAHPVAPPLCTLLLLPASSYC